MAEKTELDLVIEVMQERMGQGKSSPVERQLIEVFIEAKRRTDPAYVKLMEEEEAQLNRLQETQMLLSSIRTPTTDGGAHDYDAKPRMKMRKARVDPDDDLD